MSFICIQNLLGHPAFFKKGILIYYSTYVSDTIIKFFFCYHVRMWVSEKSAFMAFILEKGTYETLDYVWATATAKEHSAWS